GQRAFCDLHRRRSAAAARKARAHAIRPALTCDGQLRNHFDHRRSDSRNGPRRARLTPCDRPRCPRLSQSGVHIMDVRLCPKLDPREEHFRIAGPRTRLSLFLRFLPAANTTFRPRRAVLYVHGATFPSALSIAYRFDGRSWRDALVEAGFDVWGLDFYGFGHSDRYPEMDRPANETSPLGVADDAAKQVEAAVRFILGHQNISKLSLITHSWGSMPACLYAGRHPALVDRLVLFAPIARREPSRCEQPPTLPAWRVVTLEDQWNRFVEDVPAHETPVLSRVHFEEWGQRYLDSDPESRRRDPFGVKTPLGPLSEIIKAWNGLLAINTVTLRAAAS